MVHWTYENLSDGNARDVEARANGVHTLGDKVIDSDLADIDDLFIWWSTIRLYKWTVVYCC